MTDVPVADHEAIQVIDGDYLAALARLVKDGKARNDPTLAVGLSIDALGLLVDEVTRLREGIRILQENYPKTVSAPMDANR